MEEIQLADGRVKYRCLLCGEDAPQKYVMNRHIRQTHPTENRLAEARSPPTALFKLGPYTPSYLLPDSESAASTPRNEAEGSKLSKLSSLSAPSPEDSFIELYINVEKVSTKTIHGFSEDSQTFICRLCMKDGLVRNFARPKKQDVIDHIRVEHKSVPTILPPNTEEQKKPPRREKTRPVFVGEKPTVASTGGSSVARSGVKVKPVQRLETAPTSLFSFKIPRIKKDLTSESIGKEEKSSVQIPTDNSVPSMSEPSFSPKKQSSVKHLVAFEKAVSSCPIPKLPLSPKRKSTKTETEPNTKTKPKTEPESIIVHQRPVATVAPLNRCDSADQNRINVQPDSTSNSATSSDIVWKSLITPDISEKISPPNVQFSVEKDCPVMASVSPERAHESVTEPPAVKIKKMSFKILTNSSEISTFLPNDEPVSVPTSSTEGSLSSVAESVLEPKPESESVLKPESDSVLVLVPEPESESAVQEGKQNLENFQSFPNSQLGSNSTLQRNQSETLTSSGRSPIVQLPPSPEFPEPVLRFPDSISDISHQWNNIDIMEDDDQITVLPDNVQFLPEDWQELLLCSRESGISVHQLLSHFTEELIAECREDAQVIFRILGV